MHPPSPRVRRPSLTIRPYLVAKAIPSRSIPSTVGAMFREFLHPPPRRCKNSRTHGAPSEGGGAAQPREVSPNPFPATRSFPPIHPINPTPSPTRAFPPPSPLDPSLGTPIPPGRGGGQ